LVGIVEMQLEDGRIFVRFKGFQNKAIIARRPVGAGVFVPFGDGAFIATVDVDAEQAAPFAIDQQIAAASEVRLASIGDTVFDGIGAEVTDNGVVVRAVEDGVGDVTG